MTIKLRPYQEQALDAEALYRREHPDENRLVVVMATGLGKTIVMAERARRFLNKGYDTPVNPLGNGRVLILVHTDELARQAEAKVRLMAGQQIEGLHQKPWTVGVVKAERDEVCADIVIGSVQTLANPARRERLTDVGLVIVDECHHAVSDSYQAIMRHYGCYATPPPHPMDSFPAFVNKGPLTPALGLTATLERGDGASLGGVWHNVVFTRDISWGVRKGHLVQPVGYKLEIDLGAGHPFSTDGVDQDWQLIESLAPEKIVEWWQEYAKNRPTVLFAPLVRSASAFADAFAARGIMAAVVQGDMPKENRRRILAEYENGETEVLCNPMVLTEGWDSPRTKCVIVARPTQSRPLFIQMAGRGLRPDPLLPVEDQNCILLVVGDATTDLCTIADLSDKPLDRKAQGALTALEDRWDIGADLVDAERVWTGRVDARQFDPLVVKSSKVWRATQHGTPFLPISKDGDYVFIVGTSVFVLERKYLARRWSAKVLGLGTLPDLELAMTVAEDAAQERGGDLGKLLADKGRAWRKERPSPQMIDLANSLGLGPEVAKIMNTTAGGKAGRVADLISARKATRALEPAVKKIKEMKGE
jgi:superfamily II DNA or RNA helicase